MTVYNGGSGNDVIVGTEKVDDIYGHGGDDILRALGGDDEIFGGDGDDHIFGGDGSDVLSGEHGDDELYGEMGSDELDGGDGADLLSGGIGTDALVGGDGRDTLIGGQGDDTLDGGDGVDVAVFSGNQSDYKITVKPNGTVIVTDLRPGATTDGVDKIVNVERLQFADSTRYVVANQGPIASADELSASEDSVAIASSSVLANDFDGDGDPLSVTRLAGTSLVGGEATVTLASGALLTMHSDGSYNFDPNGQYEGLAEGETARIEVLYETSDGHGGTATGTLTITVTGANDAPLISGAVSGSATEDGASSTLVALANATDVDGGASLSVVNVPEDLPAGVTYDSVTGSFTLDPTNAAYQGLAAGATSTVSVSYGVSDGTVTTAASVSWTVTGTNDGPVLTDGGVVTGSVTELANAHADENSFAHTAEGAFGFSDADTGDSHSVIASITAGASGYYGALTATVDPLTDEVNWSFSVDDADLDGLAADETVTQTYTITLVDGSGATVTRDVTVTITGAADNSGPTVVADDAEGHENQSLTVDVLANDSDADGDALTLISATAPADKGSVSVVDGKVVFDPGTDFDHLADGVTESITIDYVVREANGLEASSTLTILITGRNDAPVVTQVLESQSGRVNEAFSFVIDADLMTDADDGDSITYSAILADGGDLPAWLSFDAATRTFSGTPASTDANSYSVRITATDENGASVNTTFALVIVDGSVINGTDAGETIYGTIQGDVINALGGNDTVYGLPGADLIRGGAGHDNLNGEAGNDVIEGGGDNDSLNGGDGADQLFGQAGNDSLDGGGGNDILDGGDGDDSLFDTGGTNSLSGGAGNDRILLYAWSGAHTADGGDGNDRFSVSSRNYESLITTGAGADSIYLSYAEYGAAAITISDFTAGAGGDIFSLLGDTQGLLSELSGWDGSSNPFGSGFLRLVQDGANTLLQWDQNGATGGSAWQTVVVFQNTNVGDFTDANFQPGYHPDGSPPVGQTIDGTENGETLTGTIGDDTITGLGGNDTIYGGPGADLIRGGAGHDNLNGEAGNDVIEGGGDNDSLNGGDGADQLFGQAGNDSLDGGGGNDILDGGDGDDSLFDTGGTNSLSGGAGNDRILLYAWSGAHTADGGDGNDRFSVSSRNYESLITTGAGADSIYLSYAEYGAAAITISDFTAGAGGDIFSLLGDTQGLLSELSGWDGSSNPFGSGFLRLVQDGANTLLQWDQNGATGGSAWQTVVVFQNTNVGDFTDANFQPGYHPDGSPPVGQTIDGTENGETLTGTIGDDTITGLGGNDTIYGGPGADLIRGGAGHDNLNGEAGNDVIEGGGDNDSLNGGDGADQLFGQAGNDSLDGGGGNDILDGGDGDDSLFDTGGTNSLSGGAGNDRILLYAWSGAHTADGGDGNDRFSVSSRNYESLITTGAGADSIYLSYAEYGAAAITISDFTAGAGGDIFSLLGDTQGLLSELSGWDGSSNPFGSGFLRLVQDGANTLLQWDQNGATGGSAWQTVVVFQNTNVGDFTEANFTADTQNLQGYDPTGGGINGELRNGTSANDTLTGTIGDDVMTGLGGDDTLTGGNGNDAIDAGDGADELIGGFGADLLTGGAGNDVFVYNYGSQGSDTITDFTVGSDQIQVSASGFGIASISLVTGSNPVASGTGGQFLYDTDDGRLSWDADGTGAGAAVLLANLQGAPSISSSDFLLVG